MENKKKDFIKNVMGMGKYDKKQAGSKKKASCGKGGPGAMAAMPQLRQSLGNALSPSKFKNLPKLKEEEDTLDPLSSILGAGSEEMMKKPTGEEMEDDMEEVEEGDMEEEDMEEEEEDEEEMDDDKKEKKEEKKKMFIHKKLSK